VSAGTGATTGGAEDGDGDRDDSGAWTEAGARGGQGATVGDIGAAAKQPQLSIYDDWEGDDDGDFGGVI